MTTPCLVRRAFILHIDLDPISGAFHTPRSAYENIQAMLDDGVGAYTPIAIFGVAHPGEHAQDCDRKRVCFVIFVDLDPVPGSMHTQESAHNILRFIFQNRIPHYHPIVSLAPDRIQPDRILECRGVV